MIDKKEMTAPNVSVGADTEQSIQKCTDISINDNDENIKDLDESFREMQREMLRQMDPSYLKTVSMSALYDTALSGNLLVRGFSESRKEFYDGTARLPYQHWNSALELQSPQCNRSLFCP